MVLAGGLGRRMGGQDKGLMDFKGTTLVRWAANRVMQQGHPWVANIAINANRHSDAYSALDLPVWRDTEHPIQGPLAGILSGLTHATTDWLLCVPCDTPFFPEDLVMRMVRALNTQEADVAMAWGTSAPQEASAAQPAFALVHRRTMRSLLALAHLSDLSIQTWAASHRVAWVRFDQATDDPWAFFNINTPADLEFAARQQHVHGGHHKDGQ